MSCEFLGDGAPYSSSATDDEGMFAIQNRLLPKFEEIFVPKYRLPPSNFVDAIWVTLGHLICRFQLIGLRLVHQFLS